MNPKAINDESLSTLWKQQSFLRGKSTSKDVKTSPA